MYLKRHAYSFTFKSGREKERRKEREKKEGTMSNQKKFSIDLAGTHLYMLRDRNVFI